jgi:hypothetical protein
VIEGEFEAAVGPKAVGFSHSDFGLIVQALYNAAGKVLLSTEVVEDQFAMFAYGAAIFFIGSMRERMT